MEVNVRQIREDIAAVFQSRLFTTYSVLPEMGELPLAAVSWPDEVRYHDSLAGGAQIDVVVTLAFDMGDMEAAQRMVDDVMSTPGWVEQLNLSDSLAWQDATVMSAGNVRQVNVGAAALAVDLVIEVLV